ncbi:MAG: hypothetical protein IJB76_07515 [Clostridia bacterium]|nr:hypothetical protein [Clostridia bacterium]
MKRFLTALLAFCLCAVFFTVLPAASNSIGDPNGDGKINSLDAAQILKYDAMIISLDEQALDAADTNSDGVVNSLDAAQVLKHDAGLINIITGEVYYPNSDRSNAELLPAAIDMGGREFYILQRWFGYGKPYIDFQGEVIWEDTEDGTMTNINAAKKHVLDDVQAAYNCTVTGEMSTDTAGGVRMELANDILGGTAKYDFCFESYFYYFSFVQDGFLADLNDLGIDFSKPWWDQDAVEDLSICNELYYALGDINTYDNDGTFVILFNKDLYEENGGNPQDLYNMAKDGEWTFEKFKEIITGFGHDSKADGVRDEFDTYGLLTETSNLYNHFLASGNKIIDKNANDEPVFNLPTGAGYPALTDAVDLYRNTNDVLVTDLPVYIDKYGGTGDGYYEPVTNAFKEGRGLFYMTSFIHLPYFKDMEDDFGFLPIPKYNAADDRYYHNMGTHTTSVLFVPKNPSLPGENAKQLGIIIDALSAYSKDYLTPEYYEKQLKRGDAQDPDSAEILDIIFSSRVHDLGQVYGSLLATTGLVEQLDTEIASRVDGQKDVIEMNLGLLTEKVKANAQKPISID